MKKFFALASVTALAGVVFAASAAGCSSSSSGSSSGDTGDAGKDSGGNPKTDGGKDSGPGDDDGGGGNCPAPLSGDPPWKTPAKADTTKCDQSDIDFIQKTVKDVANLTFQQLETMLKGRKAACATCIFTKESDAAWGPIVYVGTMGGAFFNYGSCYANAPGGNEACGKAVEQTELCLQEVCDKTACGSDNAYKSCTKASIADKTTCGKFAGQIQGACGAAGPSLDGACSTAIDTIAVMCGPGVLDSGN